MNQTSILQNMNPQEIGEQNKHEKGQIRARTTDGETPRALRGGRSALAPITRGASGGLLTMTLGSEGQRALGHLRRLLHRVCPAAAVFPLLTSTVGRAPAARGPQTRLEEGRDPGPGTRRPRSL